MSSHWAAFIFLFLYRYIRLVVNCFAHFTFRPIPIPEEPSYGPQDVTVIIPALDGDTPSLRSTVETCLRTEPFEIIISTVDSSVKRAMNMVNSIGSKRVRVCSTSQANKRLQLFRAIPEVRTTVTILADDDVFWPETLLPWILAPFEDPSMGGVGTCQRLYRPSSCTLSQRFWNYLGAIYLERRNFDISACTRMDGGLPCLSGRTVAYRSDILQDQYFLDGFTNETWSSYQLNADDDNFMTRWMVSHGWKTYIQYHKQCEVQTTLEDSWTFIKQCLRWSRSNWRSNLTSMFVEGHIWTQQPWSTYAVHLTTITAWAIINDALLAHLLYKCTETWSQGYQQVALVTLALWLVFSRFIKLVGHFVRYPVDVLLFPLTILFGYLHGFIKLYAMLTLHVTTWGSRANADTDDAWRMIRLPPYTPAHDASAASSATPAQDSPPALKRLTSNHHHHHHDDHHHHHQYDHYHLQNQQSQHFLPQPQTAYTPKPQHDASASNTRKMTATAAPTSQPSLKAGLGHTLHDSHDALRFSLTAH